MDVFAKPDGYDPQSDASVRVQIGKLRRKLEEYYLAEGASDPLLLQLPKRHFAISFEYRAANEPLPAEDSIPCRPRNAGSQDSRLLHAVSQFCSRGWLLFLKRSGLSGRGGAVPPELSEIWKPFSGGFAPGVRCR